MQEPLANVRLVIEDVFWPFAPLNVRIGDLFFVGKDVYFVCYHDFQQTAPLAFLVGGIAGGVASSSLDKGTLEGARQIAGDHRARSYALTLGERIDQFNHSVVIRAPKSTVYDDKSSAMVCTSATGEETRFYVPGISSAARDVLVEFPKGESSAYPATDPAGLSIQAPSPRQLMHTVAGGYIDEFLCERIAGNALYMLSFYCQIKKMRREERDSLIHNLPNTPRSFQRALAHTVRQEHRRESRKLTQGILALVFFAVVAAIMAFVAYYENDRGWATALAAFALLFLAVIPMVTSGARKEERVDREITGALSKDD